MTVSIFFKTGAGLKKLVPALKRTVLAAAGKKAGEGAVNLILVSDAEIRRLNRAFLSRGGVTDIIAFNHPRVFFTPRGETPPFGDIYICLPQARRQAKTMGHCLETELLVLAAHGALHLAGMDDSTPALRAAMNRKTLRLLRKL